jgi:hypothetical protein
MIEKIIRHDIEIVSCEFTFVVVIVSPAICDIVWSSGVWKIWRSISIVWDKVEFPVDHKSIWPNMRIIAGWSRGRGLFHIWTSSRFRMPVMGA